MNTLYVKSDMGEELSGFVSGEGGLHGVEPSKPGN